MITLLPTSAIGIFDSGVGGLSVWREIHRQLPHEDTRYVADQAHIPYGPRRVTEIRRFARGITKFLIGQQCKVIVVACNTASGAALHTLRAQFPDIPFVGMEPAVKPAAEHTKTGVIGVIATPTTFQGDLFRSLVSRFGTQVNIHEQTCPGLVELVESGKSDSPAAERMTRRCVEPLLEKNIDQLVLGCTHYPFLYDTIRRIVGPNIAIIDPSPAIARQVKRVLASNSALNSQIELGTHICYTSSSDNTLKTFMETSIVHPLPDIQRVAWQSDSLHQ